YGPDRAGIRIPHFEIAPGSRVALVGKSGVGKSTLARLLFGLLSGYAGTIEFMGIDVTHLPISKLRERISYLTQESCLFRGTIWENIAYGARDPAAARRDEIERALSLAGLAEDVAHLPEGLMTQLETVAQNFSAGQRRRLCLARVLIRSPDL